MIYSVNGRGFNSFFEAVAYARPLRANVVQIDNGMVRWHPAPERKAKKRHVLVEGGVAREFSKVRR